MACLDYVLLHKGGDEAHYRQLMTEPEWLFTHSGKTVCEKLA